MIRHLVQFLSPRFGILLIKVVKVVILIAKFTSTFATVKITQLLCRFECIFTQCFFVRRKMFERSFFLLFSTICVVFSVEVLHISPTVTNSVTPSNENVAPQLNKSSICVTETCVKESAIVLSYLNQNVDPCTDFYEFVCGQYLHGTNISDDKVSGTLFSKLQHRVSEQLEQILIEQSHPDEPRAIRLSKQLTKTCLNETKLNEQGIAPMIELLERYGGWPVVKGDKWNAESWNWLEIQQKMYDDGFIDNLILDVSFGPYFKNSTKNVLNVRKMIEER